MMMVAAVAWLVRNFHVVTYDDGKNEDGEKEAEEELAVSLKLDLQLTKFACECMCHYQNSLDWSVPRLPNYSCCCCCPYNA